MLFNESEPIRHVAHVFVTTPLCVIEGYVEGTHWETKQEAVIAFNYWRSQACDEYTLYADILDSRLTINNYDHAIIPKSLFKDSVVEVQFEQVKYCNNTIVHLS